MKAFSTFLFFAAFLIVSSILFGISACTPHKKDVPPVKESAKVQPVAPVNAQPVPANLPISVDFDQVPLSQVAEFITTQTGVGLLLTGLESSPFTWSAYKLTKDKLFDSFESAVRSSGLLITSVDGTKKLFSIQKPPEPKTAVLLNYARSGQRVFLQAGSTIYPLEKFPFEARYDSGHWYALVPKSHLSEFFPSGSNEINAEKKVNSGT